MIKKYLILIVLAFAFMTVQSAFALKEDTETRDLTQDEQAECEKIANIVYQVQSLRKTTDVWDFWYRHADKFDNDVNVWYISRFVYRTLPKETIPIRAKMSFLNYCGAWVYNNKPKLRYKM